MIIRPTYMTEHFLNIIQSHVDFSKIDSILEVGSRDCAQAIELSKKFTSAKIYCFEANPESAVVCRVNSKDYPNIRVIESAALDVDGEIDFFPVDLATSPNKNIGASSMFKFSKLYQSIEALTQKQIRVPCQRIDTWASKENIQKFDLLWCDAEASDLLALKGMGDLLLNLKALQVEVEFREYHVGQTFYEDLHAYLLFRGFKNLYVDRNGFRSDAIYVNTKL